MSKGRKIERLGNYARVQGGYAYPSASFLSIGVPVLKIQNIRWRDVSTDELSYVPIELAQETARFYVKHGDVLISMTGSWASQPNSVVGRVARFTGESDSYLINQRVGRLIITRPDELDLRFLFFTLCDPDYQDELVSGAGGSANQANISGAQIEALKILIPPIDEQRAIARILSTLDDKIELNRQMSQTLEALALALFKSWFVDFDPVAAKAAGHKPYGMNEATAALFPNRFEDSEFGAIPKEWKLKPLDEIANYENGLALQNFRPTGDKYLPVIKIKELRQGQSDSKSEKASPHIKTSCVIDDGDIIFSWSGSLIVDIWCGGKGALNQHLFKVTSADYPKWFYYFWTKEHLADFQDIASGKATTMGHIQRRHLSAAMSVVPSRECLERADTILAPMIESIINNRTQSRTLAALRDALLPKLLSGEIRVHQAENLVAEAV